MAKLPVKQAWRELNRVMFPEPDPSLPLRRQQPPDLTFDDLPRPPPLDEEEAREDGLSWSEQAECFEYHDTGSTWSLAGQAGAPIDRGALVATDERGLLVPADPRRTQ